MRSSSLRIVDFPAPVAPTKATVVPGAAALAQTATLAADIKEVYAEAKGTGFDTKTMRHIVRLRKMEKHHRDEADALLETYRNALGLH